MQLARKEKQLQNADNGDNVRCSMAIGLARGFGWVGVVARESLDIRTNYFGHDRQSR